MSLIHIDTDKCQKDGLCAAECPAKVIYFNGKRYPRWLLRGEEGCLRCGHCVAVCPHGALDHAEVPLEACPEIDPDMRISTAQAVQFLRSRRSVRRFKKKAVGRETVQQLIETGRYAPTGSNSQLVEWVVFDEKDQLRAISEKTVGLMRAMVEAGPAAGVPPYLTRVLAGWDMGIDTVLWDAPCLVVAMAPAEDRNGMVNLSLALSYFELMAPLEGLGTCWAGLLRMALLASSELQAAIGIPKDYPHYYPMMVGYPKVRYHRLPERRPPKIRWMDR